MNRYSIWMPNQAWSPPYTDGQIRQMLAMGQIHANTPLFDHATQRNLPLGQFQEFAMNPYGGMAMPKNRIVAGVLALFVGSFGVHRFYLGYTQIGLTQAILLIVGSVTNCVGIGYVILLALEIWVLIDAIRIFSGSLPDAAGRPLMN